MVLTLQNFGRRGRSSEEGDGHDFMHIYLFISEMHFFMTVPLNPDYFIPAVLPDSSKMISVER